MLDLLSSLRIDVLIVLVIAIAAALLMRAYRSILIATFIAATLDLVASYIFVVIATQEALRVPDVSSPYFWQYAVKSLVGYFVAISILFFAKRLVFRLGEPAKSATPKSIGPLAPTRGTFIRTLASAATFVATAFLRGVIQTIAEYFVEALRKWLGI